MNEKSYGTDEIALALMSFRILSALHGLSCIVDYIDNNHAWLSMLLAEQSFGFESVAIKQEKNICESRLDTVIQGEVIKGIRRPVPLMASNMSTVTNSSFCNTLWDLGALGVMHRAMDDDSLVREVKTISSHCDVTCASVGVGDRQVDLAERLIRSGANVIFIDIAHGYSDAAINQGRRIAQISSDVKVVMGNTTNTEMIKEISDFAAGLKVGIGQGKSCETKNTAGCTEKQFTAVLKFRHLSHEYGIPIISDGGIREPADFVKAIGAGASCVMAGSIFAACPESAAELVTVDGVQKKLFAGMASRWVQNQWKGGVKNGTCTEGTIRHLDVGESAEKLIERYSGALRSGITYSGCKTIDEFKTKCKFIRIMS